MNQTPNPGADGFAGSTAIVTGAGRGFGRAIATALATAGAEVVGVARTRSQLEEVRAQLGVTFTPVVADAADPATAALGSLEPVVGVHLHPGHPAPPGRERVTGPGELLLLFQQLSMRARPFLGRHDRGCVHRCAPFELGCFQVSGARPAEVSR